MSKTHFITIGNACNASNGKIRQRSVTVGKVDVTLSNVGTKTVTVGNGDSKNGNGNGT